MTSLPLDLPAKAAGAAQNIRPWWRISRAVGIVRLTWIACGVSIAVLGVVAVMVRQADLIEVHEALDASVSLDAKGYAKFVMLNVAIIDRQLTALREQHLQGLRLPAQAVMNGRMKELNGMVLQVAVANAEGQIVDSSLGTPHPAVSIADRPHFQAFKNNPQDRLFISEPVLGWVSKRLSLELVRPMLAPDGSFRGVMVASIDPEMLKSYHTDLRMLDSQDRLSIIGTDGVIRFRLTSEGFSAGQNVEASDHWDKVRTLPEGIFAETSLIDGVHRRVAFHRVEGYPLVVKVGAGINDKLRSFDVRWQLIWSLTLALAAVMAVVAGTIAKLAKEQKRSFALLQESRARALESNQTQSNFLASVSHELRTPLNSILGFSELIRDTGHEPRISQYAGLIHKSGTHLHALVNTILDLSKIESGHMGLSLETIDMPELLETLTSIHKVNADQKMVELSLSMDGVVRRTVKSDRTKLVQVLNNVIHNAIKFTPAGAIFVVMKPAGDAGLLICVIDTGIGIAPDKTAQVFERFNTIDTPMDSSEARGSGLGLALCRELLHLMQGRITLFSEEGTGTTVEIFIPFNISPERKPA